MRHICKRSYGAKPIYSGSFIQVMAVPGSRWVGFWPVEEANRADRPPELLAWVYKPLHWAV